VTRKRKRKYFSVWNVKKLDFVCLHKIFDLIYNQNCVSIVRNRKWFNF